MEVSPHIAQEVRIDSVLRHVQVCFLQYEFQFKSIVKIYILVSQYRLAGKGLNKLPNCITLTALLYLSNTISESVSIHLHTSYYIKLLF